MTDEGKLNRQRDRGQKAQALLDNPLVQEFFDNMDKKITESWQNSPADGDRERNNAYLMHRLLQNFKQQFVNTIRTGEKASKELLRIKEASKLRRVIGGR